MGRYAIVYNNFLFIFQCDEEEPQEKRYLSPDELIYAQPVDIKPIGRPVASIPVRGPPRAYGPAKPMPYPPRPQKVQPPKRIGYGNNYRPGFSEKYGISSGNGHFSQSSSLYGGQDSNYVTRPPSYANESPYTFENSKPGYNKVPVSSAGTKTEVVQQHVHHHYVHGDDNKDPKVIIKPVAIPVGSVGYLNSQSLNQQATDIITAGGGDYSGGFKPMTGVYNLDNPDTIYGSQYAQNSQSNSNKGSSGFSSQGLPRPYPSNNFDDQKYGNTVGSFSSQNTDFYKKEFQVGGSANNLYNQGPATFGQNNVYEENFHEAKAQGFECVCVNYDQCPSQEIIGRRDDLYLPIDPRNKASEITALTDEQIDNITKSEITEAAEKSQNTTETETETKKVSKREVKENKDEESTKEAEPVSIIYILLKAIRYSFHCIRLN